MSKQAKHTAGPWTVESDGTTVSMGGAACIVNPAPDGASQNEARANARLIAQAPKMLQALREASEAMRHTRHRLPKSIRNRERFEFEVACAAVDKAIYEATEVLP